MKTRYVLSCLLLGSALSVSAQKTAVKSNLLSAANGALNAGVEYAFGPKSTFDLSGSIRPWKRTEGYIIRKSKCSRILKRKVHFTKRNV